MEISVRAGWQHLHTIHHLQHRAGQGQHQPHGWEAYAGKEYLHSHHNYLSAKHILLLDDITGLLPPCLAILRSAHSITCRIASRRVVIRNIRDLHTLQRAIQHIPALLDNTMEALVETNIQPPEVEARMVAMCLGVEQLVGLIQLLDNHWMEDMQEDLINMDKQLQIIKRRAESWKNDRNTNDHIVNIM